MQPAKKNLIFRIQEWIWYYTTMGPQEPTLLEVFMVDNLFLRWPKLVFCHIFPWVY